MRLFAVTWRIWRYLINNDRIDSCEFPEIVVFVVGKDRLHLDCPVMWLFLDLYKKSVLAQLNSMANETAVSECKSTNLYLNIFIVYVFAILWVWLHMCCYKTDLINVDQCKILYALSNLIQDLLFLWINIYIF